MSGNTTAAPLRFAAPAYANSVPLAQFIPAVAPGARVVLDLPARLLAPLAKGEYDAALIPVAGLFANPDLTFIDGTGICACRRVRSVLLRCRVPLEEVRTVSLDPASRTSNALAQILLRDHWKRRVEIVAGNAAQTADAAVVIGDRALCEAPGTGGDYDLATHWNRFTGLPFVFAVWAVRRNHPAPQELTRVIDAAKHAGVAALPQIAQEQAAKLGLTEAVCRAYFADCIYYDMGAKEREAMERFRALIDMLPATTTPQKPAST